MKIICRILTQYKENYGTETAPHWKNKGGVEFTLNVDGDIFLYEENHCIEAIKSLLAKQSHSMEQFEYVSHELVFNKPIALNDTDFETLVLENIKAENDINEQADQYKAQSLYENGMKHN